jgi:hypothetical protein
MIAAFGLIRRIIYREKLPYVFCASWQVYEFSWTFQLVLGITHLPNSHLDELYWSRTLPDQTLRVLSEFPARFELGVNNDSSIIQKARLLKFPAEFGRSGNHYEIRLPIAIRNIE